MANSWGESGTTWGQGDWGQQNVTTFSIESGIFSSIATTLNSDGLLSYPEQGWGRSTWGSDDWGDFSLTHVLTGLSITTTLNDDLAAFPNTGWGRDFYGEEPWGDSYDPVVTLDSLTAMSMSLGTFPYAQSEEGWGRDEWGYGNWGENTTTVVVTDSFEISSALGPSGWGVAPWDEQVGWGGDLRFDTTQLSVITFDGLNITSTLGTPTLAYDFIFGITGPSAIGAGIGTLSINNGADHTQGLASLNITSTLNSSGLAHTMTYEISGLSITSTLDTDLVVDNTEIVNISGLAITSTLDTDLVIADMSIGLSALSAITSNVGAISPADVVGLTGLSFNVNLGSTGFAPLGYKDIDITGNTSYTYVEHSA